MTKPTSIPPMPLPPKRSLLPVENLFMAKRAAEPDNPKHWTDRELLERIWEKVNE